MKRLLESKTYLSNPDSATATAACAQTFILDGINDSTAAASAASTAEVFLESTYEAYSFRNIRWRLN